MLINRLTQLKMLDEFIDHSLITNKLLALAHPLWFIVSGSNFLNFQFDVQFDSQFKKKVNHYILIAGIRFGRSFDQ